MGESMTSLYRRGAISGKQMGKMAGGGRPAILNKTRAQSSRMAQSGHVPSIKTHINDPALQRTGAMPSRGARVNKGGQPSAGHIEEDQNPKFPSGARVKKNARPVGRQGLGGTSPGLRSSGPEYGGPSSRKYG